MELLNHIRSILNETILVPTGMVDDKIAYRRLALDDGSDVFVAFTSKEMLELGQATEYKEIRVSSLLSHTLSEDVKGIIINPWKNSYYLPKVLIEMVLDGKKFIE